VWFVGVGVLWGGGLGVVVCVGWVGGCWGGGGLLFVVVFFWGGGCGGGGGVRVGWVWGLGVGFFVGVV
jgi:hypothetical protein